MRKKQIMLNYAILAKKQKFWAVRNINKEL